MAKRRELRSNEADYVVVGSGSSGSIVAARLAQSGASVILLEAGLSFLGLGVQPPTPSWGGMILDAKSLLAAAPWTGFFPGLAIVITVLAANLFGDALRDAVDPRGA